MTEEDVAAMVAEAVAAALARRDEEEAARVVALEVEQGQVWTANLFAGLSAAIDAAAVIEEEEAQALSAAFAGLSDAIDAAIELEKEAWAKRTIRVAVFDTDGRYCGYADNRADLIDHQRADDFVRLLWRPEWDELELALVEVAPGFSVMRLPIPDLADIPGGHDEATGPAFADYPQPELT